MSLRWTQRALLFVFVLIPYGCDNTIEKKDLTGVKLTIGFDLGLGIEQLRIWGRLSDGTSTGTLLVPEEVTTPFVEDEQTLVILLNHQMANKDLTLQVDGLVQGEIVASGQKVIGLLIYQLVETTITLGQAAICGDETIRQGIETCDDGNLEAGDGCSSICLIENEWNCVGEPSRCSLCGDAQCDFGEDLCNCPQDCSGANCGDGNCCIAAGENSCTCTADCPAVVCGDGLCCVELGENTCTCLTDCGQEICGNKICCAPTETALNCETDCPVTCGDSLCTGQENQCNCPEDCGASVCNDGLCCAQQGENRCTCPADCGQGSCGDGLCCETAGENPCECSVDCKQEACGDGVCCTKSGENVCNCPQDCGQATCGDNVCCQGAAEDLNCPQDCTVTCGDGTCGDGEDACNCEQDCPGQASCGDGSCCAIALEDSCTCPSDCPSVGCGDGICCRDAGENRCSCSQDCGLGTCGDGLCCTASGEDICNCDTDCGGGFCKDGTCCPEYENTCNCVEDCGLGSCGDGICCAAENEDKCNCSQDCPGGFCGDGICCASQNEDKCTCAEDCPGGLCGDGICCAQTSEDACSCADCGESTCGDGICCAQDNEDANTCAQDCLGTCGNTTCDPGEDVCTCPQDCSTATCDDGHCCPAAGEDSCSCAADCGEGSCGDGICCTGTEDRCNCEADCGLSDCGDGVCCAAKGEDKCNCETDCGVTICSDGVCCPDQNEDPCTCPDDCGISSCSDGVCCQSADEDVCSCPADCGSSTCGDSICCPSEGENETNCPEDCGTGCPNQASGFRFSTTQDVNSSGEVGLDAWSAGQVLNLGEPNLEIEPNSQGTISSLLNLDAFAADGDARIDGLHIVRSNISIGSQNTIDLVAGDILFSLAEAETLTSQNSISVSSWDVVVFHPTTPGVYSAGTFTVLLDGSMVLDNELQALTLIEQQTTLYDQALLPFVFEAGTFLLSQSGVVQEKYIYHFVPQTVGQTNTSGDRSVFIKLKVLGLNKIGVVGLHATSQCNKLGSATISAGVLLLALEKNANFGLNLLPVTPRDIVLLQANMNAVLLFEGLDIGLDSDQENISGLSLWP